MDRFDDDILFDELRVVRPTPRPEFTAELDERAAAGFPRRSSRAGQTAFARLQDRRRAMSPRRRLMPVLGVALAALVVATGVVAITDSGDVHNPAEDASLSVAESSGGMPQISAPAHSKSSQAAPSGGHKSGAKPSNEAVYEAELPMVMSESEPPVVTNAPGEGANSQKSAGGVASGEAEEESSEAESYVQAQQNLPGVEVVPFSAAVAPLSPGHRDIERSASVVLGTKPGEVSAAAAKVYTAVHAASGIVLHSSVQSGSKGATGAVFSLLIPSRKLDDALAAFSSIAEVRERHDATADITEPTVSAAEELADSNAAIEGLLKELAGVETEAERESVEARLREERRRHASIRASLDHLNERAAMSEVTVRIVTGRGAGVTPAGNGSDGGWSVGDALHDAGQILTIAAGIILVALAVLAPIALIAFALWLANRFRLRRLRERALG